MDHWLQVISNRDTDEDQLLLAIRQLGDGAEPAGFWRDLANSKDHTKRQRRYFAFQLFARQVRPGMPLSELALVVGNPTWLDDKDITVVEDVSGYIPVQLTHDNTVFVLEVLPDLPPISEFWGIFLSVSGKVDRESFVRLLRGSVVDEQTRKAVILEVGFVPPNAMESKKES